MNGGRAFPWITRPYSVRHRFGMTIFQALQETGVIRFGWRGQILSVSGVYVGPGGGADVTLRLNGRIIPMSFLWTPIQRGDAIGVEVRRSWGQGPGQG